MTGTIPISLTVPRQTADTAPEPSARERQVAQQFEAVFLRQILKGLEQSSGLTGESSGAGVYRSMMVGALAENISESGGIGLSEIILRAMIPPSGETSVDLLPSATSDPASGPNGRAAIPGNDGET